MQIRDKKVNAFREVIAGYNQYKGTSQPKINTLLLALRNQNKLATHDYNSLVSALSEHTTKLLHMLAGSERVRIQLEQDNKHYPFSTLNTMTDTTGILDDIFSTDLD